MTGQIRVETAEFDTASANLREISTAIEQIYAQVATEDWYPHGGEHTPCGFMFDALRLQGSLLQLDLPLIAGLAGMVSDHLRLAQEWYESADAAVVQAFAVISDSIIATAAEGFRIAAMTGIGAAFAVLASPAGLATLGVGALAGGALIGSGALAGVDEAIAGLTGNMHLLANPDTVILVRSLVSAADDFLLGGGVRIGDGQNPSDVAAIVGIGGGLLTGGGVLSVRASERAQCAVAPSSIAELTATIPRTDAEGAHASITEYAREDGSRVFLVSVAGTSSPEFGGESGMDNLSNLAAYGGLDAQSLGAVRDAMESAGIEHGDQVVFAGYSQGALVATQLASSGDWDTQSVLLAGTPIHGNEVGPGVPVAQLEHDGDLITGLQGWVPPAAQEVTIVRRNPFPDGVSEADGILGPHELRHYQDTAAQYDQVTDSKAVEQRSEVLAPFAGATAVATTDYRFTR